MRITPRTRPLLTTLGLIALATPAVAQLDPTLPWRAPTMRDATGSELARSVQLDWDTVFSRAPMSRFAGAPTVEVRRNFVYVQDSDGSLTIPFQDRQGRDLTEALEFTLRQIYNVLPDEFVFIYTFTSFDTGIPAFFYSPIINRDTGIGQPRFSRGGSNRLEGYVFMNDWQSFNDQFRGFPADVVQGFSRAVFNQEAGHRWGVQFEVGPGASELQSLLGRDEAHWSYFASTQGSPMEGNRWRDNGNGSFTTQTNPRDFSFSDVDLYLMGLLPPDQVQPWFLITNPNTTGLRDIYNQQLNASSPPQIFDAMTLRGTRRDFTIQDLVTRLGPRNPAVGQAPTRWRVVFAMLAGRNSGMSEAQRVQFENMVDMYAEGFRIGTRNLGSLDYVLIDGPPKLAIGEICQMAPQCADEAPICTRPALGNDNLCTRSCANATGCPNGYCCAMGPDFGSNVCMPNAVCPTVAPDAGVAPDSGAGPGTDGGSTSADTGTGGVCACDKTTACDPGCESCDPECQPCTCDKTTACDPGCGFCDPECNVLVPVEPEGCSCTTGEPASMASAALLLVAAMMLRRRRRA